MKCRHIDQSEKHSTVPRLFPFAAPVLALATMLALVPAASLAQRSSGGHSSGFGGHSSGFGGHVGSFGRAGGFSGGAFRGSFSAPRSFGSPFGIAPRGFAAASRTNFTAPRYSHAYNFTPRQGAATGYRPFYGSGNRQAYDRGDRRGRDHRRPYRSAYNGYAYGGYPYGYVNSWELLPWDLGYPDFTGYGDDYGDDEASSDQNTQPDYAQEQPYGEQQPPPEYGGYGPEYAPWPSQPPAAPAVAPAPAGNQPELMLIFKDGHTQAVRNYMLTPSDLIVLDEAASGREPRIPLSELNLPATEREARQAGLDFSPPAA
ncbi:MAG: hypothetical protein ACRD3N_18145 [Terracidiphilus sp.]